MLTPEPTPQPTPGPTSWGLDVTSPAEGASWLHGETHVITWDATSVDSVDLYLFAGTTYGHGGTGGGGA